MSSAAARNVLEKLDDEIGSLNDLISQLGAREPGEAQS
jgi:hypothetical protein